jgi:hypothetical protein
MMGINQIPLATQKVLRRVSLTSGTSWVVPANVTEINVKCIGGGGGGASSVGTNTAGNNGGTGGTTSFTGATSALGGNGAIAAAQVGTANYNPIAGAAAIANTGEAGKSGFANFYVNPYVVNSYIPLASNGQEITSTLAVTAGASITYAIGAGGTAGSAPTGGAAGGAGGSGRIDVEYWA